jgi:hypothetical protein
MKQSCDVAPDELIAFIEEELPERRMKQLEAHVPECPVCQERLAGASHTSQLLRKTMPEPDQASRHDLLVRLYQEAERTTERPHRGWAQVASLTAVGGTFLLAAVLLWSGLSQFVDSIPQPFQEAAQEQTSEWAAEDDTSAEVFEAAPLPRELGADYPLYDYRVQSGIRLIIYQTGESGTTPLEVSQFVTSDPEPPGYMEQFATVDDVDVYGDDPGFIREIRWVQNGMAHHVQMYSTEPQAAEDLTSDDVERIVQRFLDE